MTTDPELDDDFDHYQETRYPNHLPQKGDRVFVTGVDKDRLDLERDFSGPSTYLDAYMWGADFLFASIRPRVVQPDEPGGPVIEPMDLDHWMVYPIYFLYRHSLELRLKGILLAQQAEGSLLPEHESRVYASHDLSKLWEVAKPWVERSLVGSLREAFDSFGTMVDEISLHDPSADAGRYPQRKIGRKQVQLVDSFSGIRPIDLEVMRTSCIKMLNFITWIWSLKDDEERREREERESRPSWDDE
jgi:hypothetical protein